MTFCLDEIFLTFPHHHLSFLLCGSRHLVEQDIHEWPPLAPDRGPPMVAHPWPHHLHPLSVERNCLYREEEEASSLERKWNPKCSWSSAAAHLICATRGVPSPARSQAPVFLVGYLLDHKPLKTMQWIQIYTLHSQKNYSLMV